MTQTKININPPKDITIYKRSTSDILEITEDKLKLKLFGLKKSIENKTSIFCYLGIIATIIISLISSNFNDFILTKELWKAIFIVTFALMIILLIINIISWLKEKKDIGGIIKDIKK